ncbi:hypothetical protein AAC387_Pa09g0252 [Persea americana]
MSCCKQPLPSCGHKSSPSPTFKPCGAPSSSPTSSMLMPARRASPTLHPTSHSHHPPTAASAYCAFYPTSTSSNTPTMITPSGGDEREEDAFELTSLSQLLVRGEKNMVPMATVGFNVRIVPWHHKM